MDLDSSESNHWKVSTYTPLNCTIFWALRRELCVDGACLQDVDMATGASDDEDDTGNIQVRCCHEMCVIQ